MKKLYTLYILAFLFYSNSLISQHLQWAKQFGQYHSQHINSITIDDQGNSYILGDTNLDITDLNPGPGVFNLTHGGSFLLGYSTDVFIVKLDSNGNFLWGKGLATTYTNFNKGLSIKIAPDNTIYTLSSLYDSTISDYSNILHKIDSDGNVISVKKFHNTNDLVNSHLYCRDFEINSFGDIYMTGYLLGNVSLDPENPQFDLIISGMASFIIKLDATGSIVWTKPLIDLPNNAELAKLVISPDDNLVVLSSKLIETPVTFEPYQVVYKIDSESSNIIWQKEFMYSRPNDIVVNEDGEIIVLSSFRAGNCDIDPGPEEHILSAETDNNNYLLWLTSNGEFIDAIDYYSSYQYFALSKICMDKSNNNYYILGGMSNEFSFDADPTSDEFQIGVTGNEGSPFVIKFDENHDFTTAYKLATSWNTFAIFSLIPTEDSIYFGGYFVSGADFDPGENEYLLDTTYNGVSHTDGFISKLGPNEIVNTSEYNKELTLSIYPNPASDKITVDFGNLTGNHQITIFDSLGKTLQSFNTNNSIDINMSPLVTGIYFIKIEGDKINVTKKVIKQ